MSVDCPHLRQWYIPLNILGNSIECCRRPERMEGAECPHCSSYIHVWYIYTVSSLHMNTHNSSCQLHGMTTHGHSALYLHKLAQCFTIGISYKYAQS